MREYRTKRGARGDQSEGSTSEQVRFLHRPISVGTFHLSFLPFSPPSISFSISRWGGAPAALLTGSYFLMRVDVGRHGSNGRIPIVNPSDPVSCLTMYVYAS